MHILQIDDRMDHYRSQTPLVIEEESDEVRLAIREEQRYRIAAYFSLFWGFVCLPVSAGLLYLGQLTPFVLAMFTIVPSFGAWLYFDSRRSVSFVRLVQLTEANSKLLPAPPAAS